MCHFDDSNDGHNDGHFNLKDFVSGLKMKVLKFLGIQPIG